MYILDTKSHEAVLRDSVSNVNAVAAKVPGKTYVGSVISTIEDDSSSTTGKSAMLFSATEFNNRFGRFFSQGADYVGVMNADGSAENSYIYGVTYFPNSGNLWASVQSNVYAWNSIRLNYLVALGE